MTAAERKVRERYPEAHVIGTRDTFWRVFTRPFPPSAPYQLGMGADKDEAWEDAASRLTENPE